MQVGRSETLHPYVANGYGWVLRLLPDSAMLEAGEWCSVSKIDENRPFTTIVVVVSWWRCPDPDGVAMYQVMRLQGVRC